MANDNQHLLEAIQKKKKSRNTDHVMATGYQCLWKTNLSTDHLSAPCARLLHYVHPRKADEVYNRSSISVISFVHEEVYVYKYSVAADHVFVRPAQSRRVRGAITNQILPK